MDLSRFELPLEELSFSVSPEELARIDEEAEAPTVIGQPRALEALKMGIMMKAKGYNIFVTGAPGTGRRTAVLKALADSRKDSSKLRDLAYVYNFRKPISPLILYFPKGRARKFKKDLHSAVENLKRDIDMQYANDSFKGRMDEIVGEEERSENKFLAEFETELLKNGFRAIQVGEGNEQAADILPLHEGEPSSFADLEAKVQEGLISQEEWNRKRELYYRYMDRMKKLFEGLKNSRLELDARVESLKKESVRPLVSAELVFLASKFPGKKLASWLKDFERDIMSRLWAFARPEPEDAPALMRRSLVMARYGVNVIVDSSERRKVPVVFETHPTYTNLFGSVEPRSERPGNSKTAYLKIRAGSLVQASGGFIILSAEDLVQEEEVWTNLKRALQTGKIEIQCLPGPLGPPAYLLKPEPIRADLKLIVIGNEMAYDALYAADQDFQKLFKISAELDSSMPRNEDSTREYLAFIRKIETEERLLPLTREGAAAVIEHGVRLSEYKTRLSTRFSLIADLLREASYWAARDGLPCIGETAIMTAIEKKAYLYSLPEEKFREMIVAGEILLDVRGSAIGRVNGLAVHDRGYYAFGMPAVISAQVAPGETGVVNIEHESGLSGEIYDKAVLIVEGFLRSRYARRFPLSVTASICFEQSYTAIEGDSASSTAVYALLSAIAKVPLRQDIAVTGSINQMGKIQPVGGVTEKVEGFFKICSAAGLTGTQGVMIPRQNVVNLTLSGEVRRAIGGGKFRIWAVNGVDEGIAILTGMEPGSQDAGGAFPEGSFNFLVAEELKRMAELIRDYSA